MSKLDDIIQELLEQKLLSLDGLTIVNKLKQDYDELHQRACDHVITITKLRDDLLEANKNIETLKGENTTLKADEAQVKEREQNITKLELIAQFEKEKSELTKKLFETVFANNIIKTRVTGYQPWLSTSSSRGR